jgi:hypothetical protein
VAQLYDFPGNLNSSGQCIRIIARGGAYGVKDLEGYFRNRALLMQKIWSVVSQWGGRSRPIDSTSNIIYTNIDSRCQLHNYLLAKGHGSGGLWMWKEPH